MTDHSHVSRKNVGDDRIALCPIFGCEFMKRVKPLKLGFFGFGKYPKCKKHHVPLVYINEYIGEFVDGALACLFDKAGLPSSELISMVSSKYPDELQYFIHGWVYCITTGRGAPIISQYLDSISKIYLKKLNRKQAKALKKGALGKHTGKYQSLKEGLKIIANEYARVLKHLRVHSEVLVNVKSLKSLSSGLRHNLNKWQNKIIKLYLSKNPFENAEMKNLTEIKRYYDQILNVSTCRCLIGMNTAIKKIKLTAFDRFSAYEEFYSEGITNKFKRSDLENLKRVNNNKNENVRVLVVEEKVLPRNIKENEENINPEIRLIEELINLIYKFEEEIVGFSNLAEFNIILDLKNGKTLRRFRDKITASNLSKILGISLDTAKLWLRILEDPNKNSINIKIRRITFKKVCEHLKKFCDIDEFYKSVSEVLEVYRNIRYEVEFLDKLLTIFNNYIKGGGGKSWLSTILQKSRAYIFDLETRRGDGGKGGPEHYAKYFNLLTNIHLIDERRVELFNGVSINNLKAECRAFIFEEMKKRNMMTDLCKSKYSRRIVRTENKELFDIVIFSLVALTKIERASSWNTEFVYDYTNLSRLISKKNHRDFLTGKFREGYILAKTEGRRLIEEIRKGFFKAPKACHDAIYRIKVHINYPRWRKYEKHFIDLRRMQNKEILDLNLGLDIYGRGFIEDARPFISKNGEIIGDRYVFRTTRHHLDEDQKHYLIFANSLNISFKIILLPTESHWNLHANNKEFNKNKIILNARMKHLYKLIHSNSIAKKKSTQIIKSEFKNETITVEGQEITLWNKFPDDIIEEWIIRWKARKILSDKDFYEKFYPKFYKKHYEPLLKDIELYRIKDPRCQRPEFWYWYFGIYLKRNIYPKPITFDS